MYITIRELSGHINKTIQLGGWAYNKRSSGSIVFLQFRDGTGFVQVVVDKGNVDNNSWNNSNKITIESSCIIKGKVVEEKRAPSGVEVHAEKVEIITLSPYNYPIQKKRDDDQHGVGFLLDNRHFWLRDSKQWAIQRIRNTIINAIYEYLNKNGFIKIDAPIFTPNACEGTTTLFSVKYTPAWEEGAKSGPYVYLTQSGQLYLEAAIMAHRKVFDFGPVFRAEKSKTRRHLTEFWMMDAEMAFYDHSMNMKLQEELTKYIVNKVLKENCNELNMLKRDITPLQTIVDKSFERIEHKKAIKMLQKNSFDISERDDLGADEEAWLTKQFDVPIFVEKYPKEVKAFYMKEDPKDVSRVLNNDLLAPEGYGEVIGGSEREGDHDTLLKRIKEEKLSVEYFKWYLDIRKYGGVPHSGFGIGLERMVAWICGLKHIRETIPFPRMIKRITP